RAIRRRTCDLRSRTRARIRVFTQPVPPISLGADAPIDAAALEKARAFSLSLPAIGPGLITHISLHWSATKYGWAVEAAHAGAALPYNVVADVDHRGDILLVPGMDPRKNAREIDPDE